MKTTQNLKLPQYTGEDIFDLQDINKAYDSIDKAYGDLDGARKEVVNIKNEIPKTNATAEVIDARGNKETLGKRLDEFGSQLDNKTSKEETKNVQAKLTNDIETINENLTNEIETINSQLDTKANVNRVNKITYLIDDYPKLENETYDDNRIQRAIDDVFEKGGGTIRFTKGVYIFNKTVILKDKVSLEGVGHTDFRGNGNDIVQFKHSDTFNGESILDHVQENKQGYRSNYITNISFLGNNNRNIHGIKTRHMGVIIESCSFTLLKYGIYLGSSACSVLNCFGSSCICTVFIGGTENYVTNLHDWGRINSIVIKGDGNRVSNCKVVVDGSGASEYGIVVKGNRNMISNNYIDKYKYGALLFETDGKSIYGCVVSNNYLYDNGFESTQNTTYGIVLKTAITGFTIYENIITGNVIQSAIKDNVPNTDVGIYLYADNSTQIIDNVISSNIISKDITSKMKKTGADYTLNEIINNKNFKTQNSGVAKVKNGDVILHGLSVTPKKIFLTGSNSRRCLNALNITDTSFTISMVNTSDNTLISAEETVYWRAEL